MIHAAVEEPEAARWQRRLDPWVIAAAFVAIPASTLHLLDVTGGWKTLAGVLSWAVWSVFAAEVAIMLRVSERPGRWARSHLLELVVLVVAFPEPAAPDPARAHHHAAWRSMTPNPSASSGPPGSVPLKVPNGCS